MNDNEIQLIASLLGGTLSGDAEQAARARLDTDSEFRTAYEEQRMVSSLLAAVPTVAMTEVERSRLRAALRAELHLGEGTAAPAAAGPAPWWSRWAAPLAGLATAAAIVVAVVVIPDLEDGSRDVASAPAETTALSFAGEPPPSAVQESASEDEATTTTAAAAATTTAALTPTTAPTSGLEDTADYYLAPASRSGVTLPVVDQAALATVGLDQALSEATTRATVDPGQIGRCFAPGTAADAEASLVAVTSDGGSVVAVATSPDTGEQVILLIDIATCQVTTAE